LLKTAPLGWLWRSPYSRLFATVVACPANTSQLAPFSRWFVHELLASSMKSRQLSVSLLAVLQPIAGITFTSVTLVLRDVGLTSMNISTCFSLSLFAIARILWWFLWLACRHQLRVIILFRLFGQSSAATFCFKRFMGITLSYCLKSVPTAIIEGDACCCSVLRPSFDPRACAECMATERGVCFRTEISLCNPNCLTAPSGVVFVCFPSLLPLVNNMTTLFG
jgi:hypothetical protein